jgi:CubicO group peptidase (beta-lactamase class C family)
MIRGVTALLLVCLIFARPFGSPQPSTFNFQRSTFLNLQPSTLDQELAAIESQIEAKRKETGVPGLAVSIVKDDKLIFARGFGMRDVANGLPVTPSTVMPIGSATKAFTAMATAISVDQGKLSFDDPPVKYVPYFKLQDPEANAKVTLRDLLSHRTGLASYTDVPWVLGTLNREEVIKVIGDAKPTAPLRSKFQYNNVMYSAAGEVVAAAQKTTWEDAIADLIFKPLGMDGSDTSIKRMQKDPDFSYGYSYDADTKTATVVPTRDITDIAAAGAIDSNVTDMSRWVRLILNGGELEGRRLVSEKNYHELVSTQMQIGLGVSYGFGWVLASWRDHSTIWHNGGIDGFHSLVEMIPDQHLGFVILSNTDDSPLEGAFTEIIFSNLVPGAAGTASEPSKPASGEPLSEGAARELIGTYQAGDFSVKIAGVNGKTSLVVVGQPAYPLVQKDRDTLISPLLPGSYSVQIKRDGAGKVSGITIKQPQLTRELTRAPDYSAPISTDELIMKAIEASGGQANLRKHNSQVLTASVTLVNQGMTGEVFTARRAPDSFSTKLTFEALGRKVGWQNSYFDGALGGRQSSFSRSRPLTKSELQNARTQDAFHGLLSAKTLFKEIAITATEKVGGEDAYVVTLTPASGSAVTEYYSTRSFLLLRRDTVRSGGQRESDYFSDYRAIDGEALAFKIVQETAAGGGQFLIQVKDVKFNTPIPDSEFHPTR